MTQRLLMIHWADDDEYVEVPKDIPPGRKLTTAGRWKRLGRRVKYVARLKRFDRSGKVSTLELSYARDDQEDPNVREPGNDVRWGTAVVNWNASGRKGTAEWRDAEDSEYDGPAQVSVLGGQKPATQFRKSVPALVKPRPRQQALRDQLLCLDKSCVLTGEVEEAAIEAAHIVPVKAGGLESIDNAMLLRADLHRLFDSGLFWFELTENEAIIRFPERLSEQYQKLLDSKTLPIETFQRLARALRLRAKLRGGAGDAGDT